MARDIGEQTELGVLYVRSLIRAQLKIAMMTCGIVAVVVGGLLLLFHRLDCLARIRMLGVPLPWLILGVCVQPVWVWLAAWHVRQAERTERDFAEFVERS